MAAMAVVNITAVKDGDFTFGHRRGLVGAPRALGFR